MLGATPPHYLLAPNYREGDPINKGDLLFEIDPRPFRAALDQAKGLLAQAEAKLGKTKPNSTTG